MDEVLFSSNAIKIYLNENWLDGDCICFDYIFDLYISRHLVLNGKLFLNDSIRCKKLKYQLKLIIGKSLSTNIEWEALRFQCLF